LAILYAKLETNGPTSSIKPIQMDF